MNADFLRESRDLADALDYVSPKQAMLAAERYADLKAARYVTKHGEIIDRKHYDEECERLRQLLTSYIEKNEPIPLEGVGTMKVQQRRVVNYDLPAIYDKERALFEALLSFKCLAVNQTKVKVHADDLMGLKAWAYEGRSPALVIDKAEK